jgi:hypothetical protein
MGVKGSVASREAGPALASVFQLLTMEDTFNDGEVLMHFGIRKAPWDARPIGADHPRFDWYYKAGSALTILKPYCESGEDVVLNFGIHYNEYLGKPSQQPDRNDYLSALWELSKDITSMGNTCNWRLWFSESTPQHFKGNNGNGYFNAKRGKQCRDGDVSLELDWRNVILRNRTVSRLAESLRLISFPELSSQWDAHLEMDVHSNERNSTIEFADCTHWCNPSRALQYMQTVILNNLLVT